MKNFILVAMVFGLGFGQVLEIDSIIDPGNWTNPESILVSDDCYATTSINEDVMTLRIADPEDTIGKILDSAKVFLEQHVSDPTKAFWYVVPIIDTIPGNSTPQQPGSLNDAVLCFDISPDLGGWEDLINLSIELHSKKGTGAPPQWFADYLYIYAYSTEPGIEENNVIIINSELFIPTFIHNELTFIYNLNSPAKTSIDVYNTTGMKVFCKRINGVKGTNTIRLKEIGKVPAGVYYLRLKSKSQDGIQKTTGGKFIVLN